MKQQLSINYQNIKLLNAIKSIEIQTFYSYFNPK
ncbi:hypothetical protein SAMN05192574_11167 [Mucilaginibacter gossypiicola]|uniref:Uncharacterized protein n=1 Tax=Mucilaginibacter gossypiicola TaxID=551995 RepID=A0A1H8RX96_9SPHI|nr:hypothetical protein SAMN05192574_11167 [Mucilaginibacter gossypiicola]